MHIFTSSARSVASTLLKNYAGPSNSSSKSVVGASLVDTSGPWTRPMNRLGCLDIITKSSTRLIRSMEAMTDTYITRQPPQKRPPSKVSQAMEKHPHFTRP